MSYNSVPIGAFAQELRRQVELHHGIAYGSIGVKWYGNGVYVHETKDGQAFEAARFEVRSGNLVYNDMWARMGSVAIVPSALDGAVASPHFPVYELDSEKVVPGFLAYYFKTPSFWNDCEVASQGSTGRNQIKKRDFLALRVPLPPVPEQQRIVARIEELVAKIEEARGLRRQAMAEARMLSASAAKSIFSGRGSDVVPTVRLGDVTDIRSGVTLGRVLTGPTLRLPYLRVANVQDGWLDLRTIKEVEVLASEQAKWQLEVGDVLLTEGGDWDKLGRGTVWQGEIPNCIHQNHIFRVRVDRRTLDPYFLAAVIGSPYGKEYFQASAKQTTNLATINQTQLRAFSVFCPPLEEQRHIVAYLNNVQMKVDGLKHVQTETAAELDALLPSVLDRAFSGDL
jgi:type I restriction enzyme S subunit